MSADEQEIMEAVTEFRADRPYAVSLGHGITRVTREEAVAIVAQLTEQLACPACGRPTGGCCTPRGSR